MIILQRLEAVRWWHGRAFRNIYGIFSIFKAHLRTDSKKIMNYWEQVLETLAPANAEQEAWLQSVIDTLENEGTIGGRNQISRELAAYFDELSEALALFEEIHGAKFSSCVTRRDTFELSKLRLLRDQCRGINLGVAF